MNPADPRTLLLAAGEKLADRLELSRLSAETLAATAGLAPASLGTAFGDLDGYLVALQQQFMTRLRDAVLKAATAQTRSSARLREGGIAYLDCCLLHHGQRGWFLRARRQSTQVAGGLRKQDQAYLLMLALEFKSMHWPHPQAAARLFLGQLQSIGHEEHAVRRALPELRAALWDFLDTYAAP